MRETKGLKRRVKFTEELHGWNRRDCRMELIGLDGVDWIG